MSDLESRVNCVGEANYLFEFRYGGEFPVRVPMRDHSGDTEFSHMEKFTGRKVHIVAPTEELALAAWKASTFGRIYTHESHEKVLVVDQFVVVS